MAIFGAIEAGGSKFVCAAGTGPDDIRIYEIPTTSPEATLSEAISWLRDESGGRLQAMGIGCFGPIDLNPDSPAYGYITSTPKAGWRNYDIVGVVAQALGVPVGFDTDVNAALLGESRWGAARGVNNCLYLTIGTGIGGAAIVSGRRLHGATHPEMGHIRVPHDFAKDPYGGCCPFHGDCLEGLASGPAVADRWNIPGQLLPPEHPAWDLEAHYLALGIANFACTLAPECILAGGGVMRQPYLLAMIRRKLAGILGGYIPMPEIALPALGERAGVLGALALAEEVFTRKARGQG
jgi:fructokinase